MNKWVGRQCGGNHCCRKEFKKSRGYKGKTLNDIRNTYGSEKIKSKGTILIEGK